MVMNTAGIISCITSHRRRNRNGDMPTGAMQYLNQTMNLCDRYTHASGSSSHGLRLILSSWAYWDCHRTRDRCLVLSKHTERRCESVEFKPGLAVKAVPPKSAKCRKRRTFHAWARKPERKTFLFPWQSSHPPVIASRGQRTGRIVVLRPFWVLSVLSIIHRFYLIVYSFLIMVPCTAGYTFTPRRPSDL